MDNIINNFLRDVFIFLNLCVLWRHFSVKSVHFPHPVCPFKTIFEETIFSTTRVSFEDYLWGKCTFDKNVIFLKGHMIKHWTPFLSIFLTPYACRISTPSNYSIYYISTHRIGLKRWPIGLYYLVFCVVSTAGQYCHGDTFFYIVYKST